MKPDDVLNFWFEELSPNQHWVKDESLDRQILDRFYKHLMAAKNNELDTWRSSPEGSLAEIIVLDQFSRNIYRDKKESFQQDPQALTLSQMGIERGFDQELPLNKRHFFYMPYMHSESAYIHEKALKLFSQEGLDPEFEKKHKVIIDRFGRYPHRNKILGRESTVEEIEFLKQPNSSF